MDIVETSDRREPADDKTSRDRAHAPQGDSDQKEPRATGRGRSRMKPTTISGKQSDAERGRTRETTAPDPQTEEPQVPATTQEATETPKQSGVAEAASTIWMSVGGAILLRLLVGDNSRNTDVRHR